MSRGAVMELEFRDGKVLAYQMWVAAVRGGVAILGETVEQAKVRLKELETLDEPIRATEEHAISDIELQLRLILSTANPARRTELLGDWLKIWARNQTQREKDSEPPHWLTPPR